MSPDGQYLLRLLENVHRLIPYTLVRQTLRVGNAATMINGMVRLVLAKLSVTAVTNWIGLTNNTNDGMNLMQQIISTVMAWDTSEFQKRAQKLESLREAPKKEVFKAIKTFVYASRDKHDAARNISIQESKSIIAVILETSDPPIDGTSLSQQEHGIAMEFYSNYLSIRDREELTKILCKMQPDLLTSAIKDLVAAFDPIIRAVHNAVDLSGTLYDAEMFIADLIKISKPKKAPGNGSRSRPSSRSNSPGPNSPNAYPDVSGTTSTPTVEDYVPLLRKHMPSTHKFLHQVCKNSPDLAAQYREYAQSVLSEFRADADTRAAEQTAGRGAGTMTAPLQSLFSTLPAEKQESLKTLLDIHESHLRSLKNTSHERLQSIMSSSTLPPPSQTSPSKLPPRNANHGSTHGPGMYLARWHALLDATYITPDAPQGPVRRGWEVKGEMDGRGAVGGLKNSPAGIGGHRRFRSGERAGSTSEGDTERKEREKEEERVREVWSAMESGWVGVCRGLEVME